MTYALATISLFLLGIIGLYIALCGDTVAERGDDPDAADERFAEGFFSSQKSKAKGGNDNE